VAGIVPVGPASADRGGFVIRDFQTTLTVGEKAGLDVEERITVDFLEPRHGIYRTIPVRYTDPIGYGYSLGFRLQGVTDESGRGYKTRVSHEGRYVKIRIGDAKTTVFGPVVYVLRYRVRNALGHFPQYDEIYWNAIGHEWNATIERASAIVRLPSGLPADSLMADAWFGRFGSRERMTAISVANAGEVRFGPTAALGPLEGMTISVSWPPGHVKFPGIAARIARFFGDNIFLLAPFVALTWLWRRYVTRGRDPQGPASVMVRYEPPEGMTPGEMGTLVDERADLRDLTATIVDLAVRGYLTIRIERREVLLGLKRHDETIFEKNLAKDWKDLLPHERVLLHALFESGDVVETGDLKEKFYRRIHGINQALYKRLVANGYFGAHPMSVRAKYVGLGFAALIVVVGAGILWSVIRGGIFPNAAAVPVVSGVATLLLFMGFSPAMPRRTAAGVRMRAWAKGFEEFVDKVESESLEANAAREIFERLLPYAMALGVAARWAKRFEGIYQQPPSWFQGGSPGAAFSTMSFHNTLSSAMTHAGSSMVSSPRSSGSSGGGGGGSSGGGGGGGGGGSW
jgi:uncharacterized membrane protein YgcG